MRTTLKWARATMAAALLAGTSVVGHAGGDLDRGGGDMQLGRDSVLRVPANAAFPVPKRLDVGVGRSIFVQFPVPLKDVIISDPTLMDAVVQASDRVFVIAKKPGRTNAFFFDEFGQQLLTLEVTVGVDLAGLNDLLSRLIPGSNVHGEIAGKALDPHGDGALADRLRPRCPDRRPVRGGLQGAAHARRRQQQLVGSQHQHHRGQQQPLRGRKHQLSAAWEQQPEQHQQQQRRWRPGGRLRREAYHQPHHRRGRGADHAPRVGCRGEPRGPEAVRHQPRRASQLRQLHDGDPHRQRVSPDGLGGLPTAGAIRPPAAAGYPFSAP